MMESILKAIISIVQNICLASSGQLLHGHPLVLREFLQKALPDDLTLGEMYFHSSREAVTSTLNKTP